jgi:hypothetical protein
MLKLRLFAICAILAFLSACGQTTPQAGAYHWENKLVRRPGDAAEDGKVFLVKDGKRHWVVNSGWITAHGYKWPADVNQIPAAELNAIPEGDAIQ